MYSPRRFRQGVSASPKERCQDNGQAIGVHPAPTAVREAVANRIAQHLVEHREKQKDVQWKSQREWQRLRCSVDIIKSKCTRFKPARVYSLLLYTVRYGESERVSPLM